MNNLVSDSLCASLINDQSIVNNVVVSWLQWLNVPLIVLLTLLSLYMLVLSLRDRESFEQGVWLKVFLPLTAGFLIWSVAYVIGVHFFEKVPLTTLMSWNSQISLHSYLESLKTPTSNLVTDSVLLLDFITTVMFVFCGSSLLRLKGRIHVGLPPQSSQGLQLGWLSKAIGNSFTPIAYSVAGAAVVILLIAFGSPKSTKVWTDAIFSSISILILGLGFARELNRNRIDPLGILTSSMLLAYSGLQIIQPLSGTGIFVYSMAALLKGGLFMGLIGFWYLAIDAGQLLSALDAIRRDVKDETSTIGAALEKAIRKLGNQSELQDIKERVRRIDSIVERTAEGQA